MIKALILFVLAGAALFVPIAGKSLWTRANERGLPRAAMLATAHGLRAGYDFIAALGRHPEETPEVPAHSPRHLSRKALAQAQAAPPLHRIVAQPPKEKLAPDEKAALDKLIAAGH